MLLTVLHKSLQLRFQMFGFHSRTLETEEGLLHYQIREVPGSKGTIALVHGLGTSSSTWVKTVRFLSDKSRVVALDLPGFGFSTTSGPEGFSTFLQHRSALAHFLDQFDDGPLSLVGHSLGGWLCAWYAATHPERVQHVVLVNSVGVYYRGIEKVREIFTVNSVADTRRLLDALWYRYPWYFKPFTRSVYHELSRRKTNKLVWSIDFQDLLVEELGHLTMPVSVIWGRDDAILSHEAVEVLLRIVPRARVFYIDHCGHVPQLERTREFVTLLTHVLKRRS
jgi:pimeloyl-ACP methyl ester carboxylesterase